MLSGRNHLQTTERPLSFKVRVLLEILLFILAVGNRKQDLHDSGTRDWNPKLGKMEEQKGLDWETIY